MRKIVYTLLFVSGSHIACAQNTTPASDSAILAAIYNEVMLHGEC